MPATATPAPTAAPTTAATTATPIATAWDVDGDGRTDRVAVRPTPAGGWEVTLTSSSTGELLTSPLLAAWLVDDPDVAGSADLDRDGHAEVLLRTFHGVTGDGYLALRWTRRPGWSSSPATRPGSFPPWAA